MAKMSMPIRGVLHARVHFVEPVLDFVFVGALKSPLNETDKVASAW